MIEELLSAVQLVIVDSLELLSTLDQLCRVAFFYLFSIDSELTNTDCKFDDASWDQSQLLCSSMQCELQSAVISEPRTMCRLLFLFAK